MNYTLRQLEVFTKICEYKSITKAAEALHMTQPAASIQLKNFQDQFDISLTEVIGRQLYVTAFGEEIYAACINILNETKKIEETTMAYKGHLTGKMTLSIVSTAKYIMPFFLSDFLNENPGVELVMDVTNKSSVIESLNLNKVDFSLDNIFVIDVASSTKNSGYIGYKYSGTAGSNANVLTFGHWGSDNLMNIDGLGNVGIGDTTPSYKLDVAGTIRATGDVIAYSDVRVKENIKTIDNSLEKVSKLRGVEFNKIGDNKKSIGVIAQEIEKVIPEVVKEDDKGMKSVAYGNISGLLIEAIKELKAEIEELKLNKCNCNK